MKILINTNVIRSYFFTCVVGLLLSSNAFASQLDQIKWNAQFVTQYFGQASGIKNFGCNNDSIDYLDKFISRQSEIIKKDPQTTDKFISLFGSFLGECIVSTYNGKWIVKEYSAQIEVITNGKINIIQPFQKVAYRIQSGESESLENYFKDVLPVALGKPAN